MDTHTVDINVIKMSKFSVRYRNLCERFNFVITFVARKVKRNSPLSERLLSKF